MINKILFALFICAASITSFGQIDSTNIEILKSHIWYMEGLTDKSYSQEYGEEEVISRLNNDIFITSDYYLSDSPTDFFDSTKVGLNQNGNYIISFSNKSLGIISVLEIIEINQNQMILRNIEQENIDLKFLALPDN